MLLNFLKTALRVVRKYKVYSFINVAGLAVGVACFLLIFMFVYDELSYDGYHEKAERIFRIAGALKLGAGEPLDIAVCPAPLAGTLAREMPEVQKTARFRDRGDLIVRRGETSFRETRVTWADQEIFDIFSIPFIAGEAATALREPLSVVLSRTTAVKYFGDENPVGKTLRMDNSQDFLVTGVFQDIPKPSHFHFDLMVSMSTIEEGRETTWTNSNFVTYLLLAERKNRASVEGKLTDLILRSMEPEIKKFSGYDVATLVKAGYLKARYYLQPVRDIHLRSRLLGELEPTGDIKSVYIFSAIAVLILLLAAVNSTNLTTARAAARAQEVGVRKAVGSSRSQLILQFLAESALASFLAVVIALVLIQAALPFFNALSGKSLTAPDSLRPGVLAAGAAIVLATALLGGLYPAFVLSRFRPAGVLKGKSGSGGKGSFLRRGLVVFQFAASAVLMIGTIIVGQQLRYIRTASLGFNREQVFVLQNGRLLGDKAEAFKGEVLRNPQILSGTAAGYLPVQPSARNNTQVFPEGDITSKKGAIVQCWYVDDDYIGTMGMKILAGRNFFREFPTDKEAVLINQAAARLFGWKDPLGKNLGYVEQTGQGPKIRPVIGLVEDFHFESLREAVGPLVMFAGGDPDQIAFRLRPGTIPDAVNRIRETWNALAPGQPFEYAFLDDQFNAMYRDEQRTGKLFWLFAALAVAIGCLGLFGLAAYMMEQRTKEIGIRKVLGASVTEILFMTTREFLWLVVAANIVAWPIAYYFMNRWLQGFAYRTGIGPGPFLLSAGAALLIALATVSGQALQAGSANPVDSLRYE